ncbi:hypothetical protein PV569_34040 [Streptomyces scabiei]|uniref:hypothetical protein n=1 Tax=Streptomyces scabiei TaxID=1930 RepID=UPI0029AB124E|nr:hypothetical protein [Streptomyces scabiei]MDX3298686.1 hypothetical protein [Streptomyces scabiei]
MHVELHNGGTSESALDAMREHLIAYHATLGYAPNGNVSVQLTVDTGTARQALDIALKAVTQAARDVSTSTTVLAVELLTEDEFDRRLDEPAIPELAGLSEVADILGGISRQRAGQLAERDDFPPIVAQLKSGPVFVAEQVRAFKTRWTRTPGRPRKSD